MFVRDTTTAKICVPTLLLPSQKSGSSQYTLSNDLVSTLERNSKHFVSHDLFYTEFLIAFPAQSSCKV